MNLIDRLGDYLQRKHGSGIGTMSTVKLTVNDNSQIPNTLLVEVENNPSSRYFGQAKRPAYLITNDTLVESINGLTVSLNWSFTFQGEENRPSSRFFGCNIDVGEWSDEEEKITVS